MSSLLENSLTLAGLGRAGKAFARSWTAAGGRVRTVLTRPGVPAPRARFGAKALPSDSARIPDSDILVLALPDDAIASVAAELAPKLRCRFAFHLSGALSSEVLAPLRSSGAAIASLHPVRPFTGSPEEDWQGAFAAVEGDPEAEETAAAVARAVGARPHRLSPTEKPLYHAAATLAAGGAAAVVSVAVRGWVAAGIPEDVAREALAGLASRATAAAGARPFAEAFTGAVARRDVGTVAAHAEALAADPDALALYRALASEILDRTAGRGKEDEIRGVLSMPPPRG